MLDSICRWIPSWQGAVSTVNEIRDDVVCSLENVERILNELLEKQNGTSESVGISDSVQQWVREVYRLVLGMSGYQSTEEQLKSVVSSLQLVVQQIHVQSIEEVSVRNGIEVEYREK